MTHHNSSRQYWNTFALELKKVLNQHGMELGHLDDRLGIHRETVRRLTKSLDTPSSLPLLNKEETQQVIESLQLTQDEIMQIRAAILATAIQRMLSDRIHPDDARLAAEQILPILHKALIEHANTRGLGNTREGDIEPAEDSEFDLIFEEAYQAIDRGIEKLNASDEEPSHSKQTNKARQAHRSFKEAVDTLSKMNRSIRQLPGWLNCHTRAQQQLASARARLKDLGELID